MSNNNSHSTLRCIHRPIFVPLSPLMNWYYTFLGYRPYFKWMLFVVAFCTIMAISRKKEGTMPNSYRITSRVLYSAQCHRDHSTLHAFEQFGALYRHSLDDKHLTRPGFKLSSSRVSSHSRIEWAIGTASLFQTQTNLFKFLLMLHQI